MQFAQRFGNVFGKTKYRSASTFETALNAGIARDLSITDAILDAYGPFCRFWIENRSTELIQIDLQGARMGDETIRGSIVTEYLQPQTKIEFAPYENGEPDYVFSKIVIKNLAGAANTSNDEIVWGIGNW